MREQVLELWANTDLNSPQIADRVGCGVHSVGTFVSQARAKGDERANARAPARGVAKPPASKPFAEPPPPPPKRLVGIVITQPGSVVSIDEHNLVVACPGGDWQVSKPVVRIMTKMRNGDLFDHKTLAAEGPMTLDAFNMRIPQWTEVLAGLGVEFVAMKGAGCRIRIAGA